jgi:hypothetical protein
MAVREKRPPRRNVQEDAWLTLGGFARRECEVLNLSRNGAKLRVKSRDIPEDNLGLSLTKDIRKFTKCRLIWRDETIIGVEFIY